MTHVQLHHSHQDRVYTYYRSVAYSLMTIIIVEEKDEDENQGWELGSASGGKGGGRGVSGKES